MKPALACLALACLAHACLAGTPAPAARAWEWLCNGEGACKRMRVCDDVRPTPRAGDGPGAAPCLVMDHRHAPAAAGEALACETVMRLAPGGRWTWREACYCADPARNPDASRPFAHIVRCGKAPAP